MLTIHKGILFASLAALVACGVDTSSTDPPVISADDTCTSVFPSYWQDPNPKFATMWEGQAVSDVPPENWSGPVFRLSDAYPATPPDEAAEQPWRDKRFDPLFESGTDQATKTKLALEYSWAVMHYAQQGNIDSGEVSKDWSVCDNPVRNWYHIPFQTYDVLSGREFVHGLTREAPVSFSVKDPDQPDASLTLNETMWAVAFFNPTAAYTLGTVWKSDATASVPTDDVSFEEGAVVVKPLFVTASPEQLPPLENMPAWNSNISDPSYCRCEPAAGEKICTMVEQSEQCARSTDAWVPVRLLQFDIAIKDHRAPGTEWVFGTFVADGQRKAGEANPWNRISPLGLMWGNDSPEKGRLAHDTPPDPRKNGFAEEVIFWDTVDMLNAAGGQVLPKRPGHLGCNSRLNGPADNANSSCMSCHMTASVPDKNLHTPPVIAQFGGITSECVTPSKDDPSKGTDSAGSAAEVMNGITFAEMDGIYFANTNAATPVNMTVETPSGPKNVLGDQPQYADGRKDWIALDFSLQLSISLTQWGQWQADIADGVVENEVLDSVLPGR